MPEELDEPRLRALIAAGRHLVSELDLDAILEHLLEDARQLTGARYAAVGVLDSSRQALGRFIAVGVDEQTKARIGEPPRGRGVLGELIRDPRPLRLDDVRAHPASVGFPEGHPPMRSFLGTPIRTRGEPFGNLYLAEKREGSFDAADEQAVEVLADWAAIAIENAESFAAERLRESIEASERERGRWARELHDETLQGLGALRLVLSSALRSGGGSTLEEAVRGTLEQLGEETEKLRALISELRPAALDEIGLEAALQGLARRSATRSGLSVSSSIGLTPQTSNSLDAERENAVYRIAQEALTNVERHARAEKVGIEVFDRDDKIFIEIRDDGEGFDIGTVPLGFGLRGMRERAKSVDGSLAVESTPERGSVIRATVPIAGDRRPEAEPD